jgi:two-component system response regulator AtoC
MSPASFCCYDLLPPPEEEKQSMVTPTPFGFENPRRDKNDQDINLPGRSTFPPRQSGSTVAADVVRELPPEAVIFGTSRRMSEVRESLQKLADTGVPVLIHGESGVGKEIVAKLLHQWSPWQGSPFVKINCPSIPITLIESELFGYEKGAFTGANGTKPGRVAQAHEGTLFLDEIAELDFGTQSKLLQLLQDGEYYPIGGKKEKRVDVRVICATNRDLQQEIEFGRFRRDLFYRINVVNVKLPALRDRTCDIPALTDYLLRFYSDKFNRVPRPFSANTFRALLQHTWPGNIRELENLIKRYVILGSEEAIWMELASPEGVAADVDVIYDGSVPLRKLTRQAARQFEHKIILKVLQSNRWNRKEAARSLKISYRALLYKLREAADLAASHNVRPSQVEIASD